MQRAGAGTHLMRPSKFTDDEIVRALQLVSAGMPAVQMCRSLGITQTTFYRWRRQHAGVAMGGAQECRELRQENLRLKQLVANLLLDKQALMDAQRRK